MANSNWARWIFASVAKVLSDLATANNLAYLIEGVDKRDDAFLQERNRCEIRVNGPYLRKDNGEYRATVIVNVQLHSTIDHKSSRWDLQKYCGIFQDRLLDPIPVYNYGNEAGDYNDTPLHLGCLTPRKSKEPTVNVYHFGQVDKTEPVRQSAVDADLEIYLTE